MDRKFKCIKRVILTRSIEDIEKDRDLFERLGFEVISLPLIKTEPLDFEPPDVQPDYIVFQSAKAVKYFLKKMRINKGTKIIAVGEKTKKVLEKMGCYVHMLPTSNSAEGIVKAMPAGEGKIVLIPRSQQGREEVIKGLQKKGYKVIPLNVYRTVNVKYNPQKIKSILKKGGFIVFASPSAVRGLFANLQSGMEFSIFKNLVVVAIGKTTKGALEKFGVESDIIPVKPLMEEVAGKIHEFWQENCLNS